jgi:hypothetical protein
LRLHESRFADEVKAVQGCLLDVVALQITSASRSRKAANVEAKVKMGRLSTERRTHRRPAAPQERDAGGANRPSLAADRIPAGP